MRIQNRETEQKILDKLIRWGETRDDVRAIILTGSRANPNSQVDNFSDYDPIIIVNNIHPYLSDEWLGDFGDVLVVYRDPIRIEFGFERFTLVTQYEDGLKIDFTLWPVDILRSVIEQMKLPDYLDIGYKVLLDKDALASHLEPPTYKAYIPSMPTPEQYQEIVNNFFSESPYVAKHLSRGDLIPAKYLLDMMMKFENLRTMMEWRMEIDHEWSVKPGAYGKGLKKYIASEIWAGLESTYVGAGTEENWKALFDTINLFRDIAREVATTLGYTYPQDMDDRVMRYLQRIHGMY